MGEKGHAQIMVVLDLVDGVVWLHRLPDMNKCPVDLEELDFLASVGGKDVRWRNISACHVLELGGVGGRVGVGGKPLVIVGVMDDAVVDLARLPVEDTVACRAVDLIAAADFPDGHETLGALLGGGHDLAGGEDVIGVALVRTGWGLVGMTLVTELSMTSLANKRSIDITTASVHGARLDICGLVIFFGGGLVVISVVVLIEQRAQAFECLDALHDIFFLLALLVDDIVLVTPVFHFLDARNVLDLGAQVAYLNHDTGVFLGRRQEPLLRMKEVLGDVGSGP